MESKQSFTSEEGAAQGESMIIMKKFVYAFRGWGSGENVDSVHRHLNALASVDQRTFEPNNFICNKFYVSLSKLLSSVDGRSCIAWSAVEVLQVASRSSKNALYAITNEHAFIPALCNLMHDSLTVEKKVRLLRLLKDLTYDIKIHRQEAYLRPLLCNLCDWSLSEDPTATLVSLALGVLVNLLHRNEIAVHTFMRYIDVKKFLRALIKQKCIEVRQLVIVLHDSTHEKPDSQDLEKFVEILFPTLIENCKTNNVSVLQHFVDFFSYLVDSIHFRTNLLSYSGYLEGVGSVLEFIKEHSKEQRVDCVCLLFKFLGVLTQLHVPVLTSLYPVIATQCMEWVSLQKRDCAEAFSVLHSIISEVSKDSGNENVNEIEVVFMKGMTQDIFPMLNEENTLFESSQDYDQITSLLQLLDKSLSVPLLRNIILRSLEPKVLQMLSEPLCHEVEYVNLSNPGVCQDNTTNSTKSMFCVQLLHFVSNLVSYEPARMTMYSNLLHEPSVLFLLARALQSGTHDVKRKVLAITSSVGFSGESVSTLAKYLTELDTVPKCISNNTSVFGMDSSHPSFKYSVERDLDELMSRLQELNENNKLQSISVSELVEIMEFKQMMNAEEERFLRCSLESAAREIASLKEKNNGSVCEIRCLRRQLFSTSKSLEEARRDLASVSTDVLKMECNAQENYEKYCQEVKEHQESVKMLTNDISRLKKTIDNKEACLRKIIDEKKTCLEEFEQTRHLMSTQIKKLENQLEQETKEQCHLREVVSKLNEDNSAFDKTVTKLNQDNKNLRNEVAELEATSKRQLQEIASCEEVVATLRGELHDLQRIRDTIYEVAAGAKNKKF